MKKQSTVEIKPAVNVEYEEHPGVSGVKGTFFICTKHGFVMDKNVFHRDVRMAKTFSTWNEANEFAKSMFPKYWAILQS